MSIEEIIKAYPSNQGNMLLIVATELNKLNGYGSFVAVVFNGETKEIISSKKISGKPSGFGLRNYWAGSLYNSLKASWKKSR